MKILFVVNSYYPHVNGVYSFIKTVASELKKIGHQVAVVAPSATTSTTRTSIDGIEVFGVASLSTILYKDIRLPMPFLIRTSLQAILLEFSPDLIHIQDHFALSKMMVYLSKKNGIPMIGTNHFMTENFTAFFKSQGVRKVLERWMWDNFAKVFNEISIVTTPTQTAAALIQPKLKKKVISISNGIDLERFSTNCENQKIRSKYSLPDRPILLYVGRLDPEKHVEEILQAISLDQGKTDFCFVVVGKGVRQKSLMELSRRLEICDRVVFTGYIPENDLVLIYQASRCFITASIAELQSIATMEAMASGLPVIAANAGALAELVHENENGFLFSPGDTRKILQSIVALFKNDDLYNSMKAASLSYIGQHSLDKTIASYTALYNTCLTSMV